MKIEVEDQEEGSFTETRGHSTALEFPDYRRWEDRSGLQDGLKQNEKRQQAQGERSDSRIVQPKMLFHPEKESHYR